MISRLLIVGASGGSHIGGSLQRAAAALGIDARLCDTNGAWQLGTLGQKLYWHVGGKRPVRLRTFSRGVVQACRSFRPDAVLTTGNAPLMAEAIEKCRSEGIACLNFSTDDPFNSSMRMAWFLRAVRHYDVVFSPRTANLDELRMHGCRRVEYMRFGYDPDLFYPTPEIGSAVETSDLFFAGTAEPSRAEYIAKVVEAGLTVRLYGNYWERYRGTREISRGQADIPTLRRGIAGCRVALCLVRHENRDGHSMRTFELAAVGACMVGEDTLEHHQIFGDDGERVVYCQSPAEMVEKTKHLLKDAAARHRLKTAAHNWITQGRNTYADRLRTMLEMS